MTKISKKKRQEILEDKFPEFKRQLDDLQQTIDAVITELQEKLDKLNEISELSDELEHRKTELEL